MQAMMWVLVAYIVALITVSSVRATSASQPGDPSIDHQSTRPLTDASSLRLHVILKGKKMRIHGQSIFDVFARPVVTDDGLSVRYDGFSTFIQGDNRFTYMLVDGAAYVVETSGNATTSAATQTVRCLESLTPFESIVSALNTLKAVPSSLVDDEAIDCSSGALLQTSTPFGGVDFTVCATTGSGFIAYGGDITVAVEYLDRPLRSITAPTLSDSSAHCATVAKASAVTPITAALLTGDARAHTCPSEDKLV